MEIGTLVFDILGTSELNPKFPNVTNDILAFSHSSIL
jgi:hypothetical protein